MLLGLENVRVAGGILLQSCIKPRYMLSVSLPPTWIRSQILFVMYLDHQSPGFTMLLNLKNVRVAGGILLQSCIKLRYMLLVSLPPTWIPSQILFVMYHDHQRQKSFFLAQKNFWAKNRKINGCLFYNWSSTLIDMMVPFLYGNLYKSIDVCSKDYHKVAPGNICED